MADKPESKTPAPETQIGWVEWAKNKFGAEAVDAAARPMGKAGQWLNNLITDQQDPEYKQLDKIKVWLLAGAAGIGGFLGFGLSAGSVVMLGLGALAGGGLMAFFAQPLADTFKGVKDSPPPTPRIPYARYPEADKETISMEQVRLSGAEVLFPRYHPEANPALPGGRGLVMTNQHLKILREAAEKHYPYPNDFNGKPTDSDEAAANDLLNRFIQYMDSKAKRREINLLYTSQEMHAHLKDSQEALQKTLGKWNLPPEAIAALTPNIENLKDVPERYPPLTAELQAYGEQAAVYIFAKDKGAKPEDLTDEQKAAAKAMWSEANGNLRIAIMNYAEERMKLKDAKPAHFGMFFPRVVMHVSSLDTADESAIVYNPRALWNGDELSLWNDLLAAMKKARESNNPEDLTNVGAILSQRLTRAKEKNSTMPLPKDLQEKLQIHIDGIYGKARLQQIQEYERAHGSDKVQPKLDAFEKNLEKYNTRLNHLQSLARAAEQSKLLVLSPVAEAQPKHLEVLDFSKDKEKPRNASFDIAYSGTKIEKVNVTLGAEKITLPGDKLSLPASATPEQLANALRAWIDQAEKQAKGKPVTSLSPNLHEQFDKMLAQGPRDGATLHAALPAPPQRAPDQSYQGKV